MFLSLHFPNYKGALPSQATDAERNDLLSAIVKAGGDENTYQNRSKFRGLIEDRTIVTHGNPDDVISFLASLSETFAPSAMRPGKFWDERGLQEGDPIECEETRIIEIDFSRIPDAEIKAFSEARSKERKNKNTEFLKKLDTHLFPI